MSNQQQQQKVKDQQQSTDDNLNGHLKGEVSNPEVVRCAKRRAFFEWRCCNKSSALIGHVDNVLLGAYCPKNFKEHQLNVADCGPAWGDSKLGKLVTYVVEDTYTAVPAILNYQLRNSHFKRSGRETGRAIARRPSRA